jgi:uncharacterized protein YecE (DUF72 family)
VSNYIGTAGWGIPRSARSRFPASGSQLERYAARLNATEINSSFYRQHAFSTYERWAAAVPPAFRFAVKFPKHISHDRLLTRAREPLKRFLDETAGLGKKRGPLLLQLPPSFAFDARRVGRFFDLLRSMYAGDVVCEPRNTTWTSVSVSRLLGKFEISRVAADPPRATGLRDPGGWSRLAYFRWHGSPRTYFSSYSADALDGLASSINAQPQDTVTWAIFDNTGSGAAAANALDLINFFNGLPKNRGRMAESAFP